MKSVQSLRIVSALVLGLGAAGAAHSAGFQLLEQNASGLGNAYAGSAAVAENASTIFYNPAGMTKLEGINLSGGFNAITPSFKFSEGSSTSPTHVGGNPVPSFMQPTLGTDNGGDAGSTALVPNLYASWQINDRWFAGLGIGVPFGLATEYSDSWIGRYHSRKFEIQSINVNPSVAYKLTDQLSIGAGLNWMYLDAEYQRAVPMAGVTPVGPMVFPDATAKATLSGDGWGWNIGLLYDITPDTRVGLSYRSTVKINADGHTKVSGTPGGANDARVVADTSVKLPDTAILSLSHNINPQWQVLADVSWTGWSSLRTLDINNAPGLPSDSLTLRFRDTWRVALGANYHFTPQWTFKAGVAWDQTPIRNETYRLTSLPDNDRIWASIGAQYNFSKHGSVDIGYAHLFVKDTTINNTTDADNKGVVYGSYDSSADIFGVQVSYRF
uniref:OmpP1/FadL family transporter n=1 Tax=Castellaniella defragrans TaxID=75697 RepID=UPI003341B11C